MIITHSFYLSNPGSHESTTNDRDIFDGIVTRGRTEKRWNHSQILPQWWIPQKLSRWYFRGSATKEWSHIWEKMSKVTKSSTVTEKWATHMGLGTKRSTSTGVRYREVPPGDVQGLYRVGVAEVGGGALTNAVISHLDSLFPSEKDIPHNRMVKSEFIEFTSLRNMCMRIAQPGHRRSGKTRGLCTSAKRNNEFTKTLIRWLHSLD